MGSRYVRRVRTASGAVAVQVVTKERGEVIEVEHIGSAHTDTELALLLGAARDLLHDGQDALDLGVLDQAQVSTRDVGDWTRPNHDEADEADGPKMGRPRTVAGGGKVVRTSALTLWNVLIEAYTQLGFDALSDDSFRALVLARIIEPTSKADTIQVLDEIGVAGRRYARSSARWAAASNGTTATRWPRPALATRPRRDSRHWCSTT